MKRPWQLLGLDLALAGATRPSFAGNLLINGGFEDPPRSGRGLHHHFNSRMDKHDRLGRRDPS